MTKCSQCNEKETTDIHHEDGNHKNNDESNLVRLCAMCHARVHGNDPKNSELKYMCILRDRVMQIKFGQNNQCRSFGRIERDIPEFWDAQSKILDDYLKDRDKDIKAEMKDPKYKIWHEWLAKVKGINYITAAKLISTIFDISKFSTTSKLWRYAGLDANYTKRKKGMSEEESKRCGNPYLKKELLGVLGDSFIKQRTPVYRELYDTEKERQLAAGLTKGHAHRRAIRKMIKIFVGNLWLEWRRLEGMPVTEPYVQAKLGHENIISPSEVIA